MTLPSGDCSSVAAPVWLGEGVIEAEGAALTPDRVPDACRWGLAVAEELGRSEMVAAAEGLGPSDPAVAERLRWSAASSGLMLIAAWASCCV